MRHVENAAEKVRIGKAAAELVAPGASLFLTPSTTVEATATAIAERPPAGLRVVTNSTVAAAILERCQYFNPANRWHLACEQPGAWRNGRSGNGREVSLRSGDHQHWSDRRGWSLLEYRDEEVVVARAMLRNARHKVLLADHTKFSRVATFKLGHLRDVTTLVTDRVLIGAGNAFA